MDPGSEKAAMEFIEKFYRERVQDTIIGIAYVCTTWRWPYAIRSRRPTAT